MKTILMLRHAKSDWDADFDSDHERPLSDRGRRSAEAVGRFLSNAGLVPDRVLCSTAVRARQTVALAAAAGAWEQVPTDWMGELYGAGPGGVLQAIAGVSASNQRVLVAGHEPGWSATVGRLVGSASVRMPTGALARIDFDAEHWSECRPGRGTLRFLLPPRLYDAFPES